MKEKDINQYFVYIHKNKLNKKVYIGMTNNPTRRWRNNGIEYKPDKSENQNRPFWNAINKYGWSSFDHIIIQEGLSFHEAIEQEKELIKKFNSTNKQFGYNASEGGNGGKIYSKHPKGMQGKSQTEYQINKMKELRKNFNPMQDITWGIEKPHPKGMKGKVHSDETKEKIRKTHKQNKINCKKIKVILPDKNVKIFNSVNETLSYLNISRFLFDKCIRSGKPYKVHQMCKINLHILKPLEGMIIKYC